MTDAKDKLYHLLGRAQSSGHDRVTPEERCMVYEATLPPTLLAYGRAYNAFSAACEEYRRVSGEYMPPINSEPPLWVQMVKPHLTRLWAARDELENYASIVAALVDGPRKARDTERPPSVETEAT